MKSVKKSVISKIIEENFPAPFGFCKIEAAKPFLNCRAISRLPENAKSIIVFLFPYFTGEFEKKNISKYAMITDYHLVANEYLKKFCEIFTEKFPENKFESFVDNSPLREVSCGAAAGLGVIGKNGLLINKEFGSYIFLGEIVTDLDLEIENSEIKSCINCGKCLESCPNKALQENSSIKTEICRSFITQKKGELSLWEQEEIIKGGLIWGCDICNDVCPMNKNCKITPIPEFIQSAIPFLDKENILALLKTRAYNYRGEKTILRNYNLINQ